MKKGFTLVELLAVVILLSIILIVVFNLVSSSIRTGKQNAYEAQISEIINSAKKWGVENSELLPDIGSASTINIDIVTLINEGYIVNISDGTLKDPRYENTDLNGCVIVSYSNEYNQYEYIYDEFCGGN